jgi:hypothetical protein
LAGDVGGGAVAAALLPPSMTMRVWTPAVSLLLSSPPQAVSASAVAASATAIGTVVRDVVETPCEFADAAGYPPGGVELRPDVAFVCMTLFRAALELGDRATRYPQWAT